MSAWQRVAVAGGGNSPERDVSLKSQAAVLGALASQSVDALAFDPSRESLATLHELDVDCVFNVLHGPGGEDGCLQGALDLIDMPYTGSGVRASALAMDKIVSKILLRDAGLRTPDWVALDVGEACPADPGLGWPVFVKPASQGSSVGMTRVERAADLARAVATARRVEPRVIIERFLDGAEYTVSILDAEALPSIRIETPHVFYDYDAKYLADTTTYTCPALAGTKEAELAELALAAFATLGCGGWGRVDFMADATGTPYVIEVNTVPGMTDHSLVPMAAAARGYDFPSLCLAILATVPVRRPTTREVRHGG